jgi:hypothetical protein
VPAAPPRRSPRDELRDELREFSGFMTALTIADLSPVERTYLGVLALGLVSADQAHDDRFRMERVCAVSHALLQGLPESALLESEERSSAAFRGELRAAMVDLDQRGVIGIGPPRDLVILRPAAEHPAGEVDVNRHPPIFDRYLAQRCMDVLMADPAVHHFLIDLYAESGEVWHQLYQQGYGQYR